MTERSLPLAPVCGLPLAHRSAHPSAPPRRVRSRRGHQVLTAVGSLLGQVADLLIARRSDVLWHLNELPDEVLKDVDPTLYEARLVRTVGWYGVDPRHLPPL